MSASDAASVCQLLESLQGTDSAARQAAEAAFDEAVKNSPDALVTSLAAVLGSAGDVKQELRSHAAVLLRQCVNGTASRDPVWDKLSSDRQTGLKVQLFQSLERDPDASVRRSVAQVMAAVATFKATNFAEVNQAWPELLPAISRVTTAGTDVGCHVAALEVLLELAVTIGDGLMSAGGADVAKMLDASMSAGDLEVCAKGTQLFLKLVEYCEPEVVKVLGPGTAGVVAALQRLAANAQSLKDTLEAFVAAVDEEAEFFRDSGALQQFWATLMTMVRADTEAVRHTAMQALASFVAGLAEDFCGDEAQAQLENVLQLNIEWMLNVTEDVAVWTECADNEDEDDELDDESVEIGEANLDRFAKACAEADHLEETFLPMLFKNLRTILQENQSTWKHARACVMAVSQVSEHVEDEAWIDQCVEFVVPFTKHEHPRVRDACFVAIGQIVYDHEPYCQENHHEALLTCIDACLEDANIRVAGTACGALNSVASELDDEDLEPFIGSMMPKLFRHLSERGTRSIQEQCLGCIAAIADAFESSFAAYYGDIMPALKQLITQCVDEKDRVLRGKAFECISLVGEAVGKEIFSQDAHEVMRAMMTIAQAGFAADDPTKEFFHQACERVARTLEKDFKPYVPMLLPSLLGVLANRPTEVDPDSLPDDDEKEDMSLAVVGDKVVGLKTTVLTEMEQALSLIDSLIKALDDDFCEYLPSIAETMAALLSFDLSDDVRDETFKVWHAMAESSRKGAEKGLIPAQNVRELVGHFLKTIIESMTKQMNGNEELDGLALESLHAQANGVSGLISKAGADVMSTEEVGQLLTILLKLLVRISAGDKPIEPTMKRRQVSETAKDVDDDSDASSDDEDLPSQQTVRFALVDVVGAIMRGNQAAVALVGLQPLMELVSRFLQPDTSDGDRSLALYIADEMVFALGVASVPTWNLFLEKALHYVSDKCPAVRQHAASVLGHAAQVPVFAQMAPAAAQKLAQEIQKHSAKHKRRRPTTADGKQVALAVDSAIRAFGLLCQHQEQNIGGDSKMAWAMWLDNLPLRYDHNSGQMAHAQLLGLVVQEHIVVTSPELLPKALRAFASVHRTKFSYSDLDKGIAEVIVRLPDLSQRVAAELQEKPRKRIENMLKNAEKAQTAAQ